MGEVIAKRCRSHNQKHWSDTRSLTIISNTFHVVRCSCNKIASITRRSKYSIHREPWRQPRKKANVRTLSTCLHNGIKYFHRKNIPSFCSYQGYTLQVGNTFCYTGKSAKFVVWGAQWITVADTHARTKTYTFMGDRISKTGHSDVDPLIISHWKYRRKKSFATSRYCFTVN